MESEEEAELRLLNECLSSSRRVHIFVNNSLTIDPANPIPPRLADGGSAVTSLLLTDECQTYLKRLLAKYKGSAKDRAKLASGKCLYYLQCLVEEGHNADFITAASAPLFCGIDD